MYSPQTGPSRRYFRETPNPKSKNYIHQHDTNYYKSPKRPNIPKIETHRDMCQNHFLHTSRKRRATWLLQNQSVTLTPQTSWSQKTLFTPRDVKCKLSEYCSDLFELSSNGIPTDYFHPGHAMFYSLFDCSPSDIGGRLGSSPLHDGVGPSPPPANAWSTPPPVIAAGAKFPPSISKYNATKRRTAGAWDDS